MANAIAKEPFDPVYLAAYLRADEKCRETKEWARIEGFPGWWVAPVKRSDFEDKEKP